MPSSTARRSAAKRVDALFRALADPTRRAILDGLREGPRTVNALAANFDQSRPGISRHLRVLRESGLVEEARAGRERHYRLRPARLEPVQHWLLGYRHFWQSQLDQLKRFVETDHDE